MTKQVTLLLGVHAHQPVGNFTEVLEDAHQRCYRPFIHTLHGYPAFRFSVHFSGWLLDWLLKNHPEDMEMLRAMTARGQVEWFGGGDTEPVLAAIPSRDRLGQVRALSARIAGRFGASPRGAWLTERVWEGTVVPSLADAGIRYVTVDDYHFLCAGRDAAEMTGFFSTEEDGRRLDLFPISEALRYRIPFAPAGEAVAYIESLAEEGREAAAVYFDDIEKFGIWPETHEWVYGQRWLEQFIEGVLASPRVRTSSYRDYHARGRTRGVVYLPTTSYIEMNEWTLPADAAGRYAHLVGHEKAAGRFEAEKAFLRGGIWRNFLSRYPESNWLHKRMLRLSHRVAALPEAKRNLAMTDELYRAQSNDAYWHGLFGGLYLPHLRRACYRALLACEKLVDAVSPPLPRGREDQDLDGHEEVFLASPALLAVVKDDGRAALVELSSYALTHAFGDTLRRHPEHYHERARGGMESLQHSGEGIASAHDRIMFRHPIAPEDLATDSHGRGLFIDSLDGAPVDHWSAGPEEDAESAVFVAQAGEAGLYKRLRVQAGKLVVSYRIKGGGGRFRTQLNLAMPSCDGLGGRYWLGYDCPGGFGQQHGFKGVTELVLEDDELPGRLVLTTSAPVDIDAAPLHTVSQSEAGFEKIMQAATLDLSWDATVAEMVITLEVQPGVAGR